MDLTDIFEIYRASLAEYAECAVTMTEDRLSACYPRIVVAEDTGIFLISRRI